MLNVQWIFHSFVQLYLIKYVVCVLNCMFDQTKKIFDHFICIWKWFLSLFVFMFSTYFVFHCLNMFCFEKTSIRIFGYSFWLLAWAGSFGYLFWQLTSCKFTQKGFVTYSRLSSQLASRETPRISFLKSFFMGNLF